MRAKAYLLTVLLCSCNVSSPCMERGGRCTRTEMVCGPTELFVGFDSSCGGNDKCCVPVAGSVDAGECTRLMGHCQPVDQLCVTGEAQVGLTEACGFGNQCCASLGTCTKGRCILRSASCQADEREAVGDAGVMCTASGKCCLPR